MTANLLSSRPPFADDNMRGLGFYRHCLIFPLIDTEDSWVGGRIGLISMYRMAAELYICSMTTRMLSLLQVVSAPVTTVS